MTLSRTLNKWKAEYAVALAFAFLAICGGIAIMWSADAAQEKLYNAQIAACNRNNSLRAESNRRIASHNLEKEVLDGFIASAAQARSATGDKDVAAQYELLRAKLATITFKPLHIINCQQAIPKP